MRVRTRLEAARELLRRPAVLLDLSIAAIALGIVILYLARLPPPSTGTEAPRDPETQVTLVVTLPPLVTPERSPNP